MNEATMNKAVLIGRVSRDPEVRQTPARKTVVSFPVATNSDWRDKNGQRCTKAVWHRIVCYEQAVAHTAANYVRKGSRVYVEGAIENRVDESFRYKLKEAWRRDVEAARADERERAAEEIAQLKDENAQLRDRIAQL